MSDVGTSEEGRAAARDAGLRYVSDHEQGFTRRRRGRGFTYLDPGGAVVREADVRERLESLVVPPAWSDVWICRDARGHIQATGRDEAGRKQYIYHPRWTEVRDRVKFEHLLAFGDALPALRRRTRRDLRDQSLSRRRVLAAIVRLMDATLIRVGNVSYAKTNGSYGLTTLRSKHVRANGVEIALAFTGKGGARYDLSVRDAELAKVVRSCQEIPGQELFRYLDDDEVTRSVDSGDVNDYLRDATRSDVTAKDFRTWGGTVLAAQALHEAGDPRTATARKRSVVASVRDVASVLNNTPAVCRRAYVHPVVIETYLVGRFSESYASALEAARGARPKELRLHEAATLTYLREVEGEVPHGASASSET